jgi:hypothetical protein
MYVCARSGQGAYAVKVSQECSEQQNRELHREGRSIHGAEEKWHGVFTGTLTEEGGKSIHRVFTEQS